MISLAINEYEMVVVVLGRVESSVMANVEVYIPQREKFAGKYTLC